MRSATSHKKTTPQAAALAAKAEKVASQDDWRTLAAPLTNAWGAAFAALLS